MITTEAVKKTLSSAKQIVITTHHKPDGDALGSSLAMYHWLQSKGHDVRVIVPSDFPNFLDWMPGRNKVINYPADKEHSDQLIAKADIIFCLDFNGLSRINLMEESVRASSALKFMIDHHLEPEGFDDFRHWNSNASATAELVYDFIVNMIGDPEAITSDIADCIYTGIMTDTGSFRYSNTSASVHRIIANLIDRGAQHWKIHEYIFNSSTENRLKFLGYCLLHRLEVLPEYNTALFSVSGEDLAKFNVGTGDTEGLVNYALSLHGIRLAALIIDRGELVKLSLRSLGEFPSNEVCREHFNGGGHRNAAGGNSSVSLEETVTQFKTILPIYKERLIQ